MVALLKILTEFMASANCCINFPETVEQAQRKIVEPLG